MLVTIFGRFYDLFCHGLIDEILESFYCRKKRLADLGQPLLPGCKTPLAESRTFLYNGNGKEDHSPWEKRL